MFRSPAVLIAAVALSACAQEPSAPVTAPIAASVTSRDREATCVRDSKLIGRVSLTTGDGSAEWWGLTKAGFVAAGIQPAAYRSTIEGFFGRSFASLDDAVAYLVAQVEPADSNGNGFVCAYSIRGTRANTGDPNYTSYTFTVRDDGQ